MEDEIEIIDDHQPPTAKKKKIHPLRKLLGDNFGGPSSSATDENADNIQAEIARYKAEPQVSLEVNALTWWKEHWSIYPILSKLARRYLCLPCTSVPSESLFSISGLIVNERRAALDPCNVDKIVFLNSNLKALHLGTTYARKKKHCQCDSCVDETT